MNVTAFAVGLIATLGYYAYVSYRRRSRPELGQDKNSRGGMDT